MFVVKNKGFAPLFLNKTRKIRSIINDTFSIVSEMNSRCILCFCRKNSLKSK